MYRNLYMFYCWYSLQVGYSNPQALYMYVMFDVNHADKLFDSRRHSSIDCQHTEDTFLQ